jgi:acetylornithine deacetylase/succinyl-diaminopimelate desuccinylase-like protein
VNALPIAGVSEKAGLGESKNFVRFPGMDRRRPRGRCEIVDEMPFRSASIILSMRRHRPLLLLAHLDVVQAMREDWSVDPFTFAKKDGWFHRRGTSDDTQFFEGLEFQYRLIKQLAQPGAAR